MRPINQPDYLEGFMTIKKLIFCDTCDELLYGPTLIFHTPETKRDLCRECFIKEVECFEAPEDLPEDLFITPETVTISYNWDLVSWKLSARQTSEIKRYFSAPSRGKK